MQKFILKSGKLLAKWRSAIDYFLSEKIEGNSTNLILFLLTLFILFLFGFSLLFGFKSITDNYIPFLILLIVLVIVLVWVAIYYESNKYLETDRHQFKVAPIQKHKVRFEFINLDKQSRTQFIRLMKGRYVQEKINFTVGNKSGDSANHRILFVLFDELLVGGIQDLTGDRKRIFFQLLQDSFLIWKDIK